MVPPAIDGPTLGKVFQASVEAEKLINEPGRVKLLTLMEKAIIILLKRGSQLTVHKEQQAQYSIVGPLR